MCTLQIVHVQVDLNLLVIPWHTDFVLVYHLEQHGAIALLHKVDLQV